MAVNGNTQERLASAEKAARILRVAKKTGEPQDHVDVLYSEVAKAAETILSKHPANLFSTPQKEAMGEIIAASILMSNEAAKAPPSWLGKLWKEFCSKSPMVQIGILGGVVAGALTVTAGISAAWYATPPTLRWLADSIGGPPAVVVADEDSPSTEPER